MTLLLPPTFYVQGLLGALFSAIFSATRLPVLTLAIAVSNAFVFGFILEEQFKLKVLDTLLLVSLLVVNPLFMYSIWGFMTEQYFLLFFLLSKYYVLKFERKNSKTHFIIANVTMILGFFVRQVSLVVPISVTLHFLITKRYRLASSSGFD